MHNGRPQRVKSVMAVVAPGYTWWFSHVLKKKIVTNMILFKKKLIVSRANSQESHKFKANRHSLKYVILFNLYSLLKGFERENKS